MKSIQETLKQLHGNICIFSRSIEQLTSDNEITLGNNRQENFIYIYYSFLFLADTLQRHLIRSLCTDMFDIIIREIDTSASSKTGQLSIEVRKTNLHNDI